MKRAILGTLVGMGLVMAAAAVAEPRGEYLAQRGAPATSAPTAVAGTELIVVPTSLGDKTQMLTATGKIALKSVRNIQWDLQINDLNNENPLPQQIQSLLQQK